jgi:hypothetical protein
MGTGVISSGVKRLGREADLSLSSSAYVKKAPEKTLPPSDELPVLTDDCFAVYDEV